MLGAIACSQPASKPHPTIEYETPTPVPEPTVREIRTVQPASISSPTIKAAVPKLETIDTWLARSGWPISLIPEAEAVACGIGNRSGFPSGESGCHPWSSNGRDLGLFQLDPIWFSYCGTDLRAWADPVVNAATALCVYRYDVARGEPGWAQWQVQP